MEKHRGWFTIGLPHRHWSIHWFTHGFHLPIYRSSLRVLTMWYRPQPECNLHGGTWRWSSDFYPEIWILDGCKTWSVCMCIYIYNYIYIYMGCRPCRRPPGPGTWGRRWGTDREVEFFPTLISVDCSKARVNVICTRFRRNTVRAHVFFIGSYQEKSCWLFVGGSARESHTVCLRLKACLQAFCYDVSCSP